ncbi:MAG TPA: chemotaxis protein CheW [Allosphingosinicella sp.]|jgi:purine-binding chemotaxis protein CheW|nr:chemotaxis protein CheW [Allosphingosinicella sp.]
MAELLLIVRLAGERVALPASDVESVVEIDHVVPAPGTPLHVAGLAALRSRVLTVIDCPAALGFAPGGAPHRDAVVAVIDGHPYALMVENVEDVVEGDADPVPLPVRTAPLWRRVAKGMVAAGGELLLLIDVPALVAGPASEAA